MKKRTICLLLAMIMVLSIVLAGCSKTAETPAADETPATTEPAETTDNTETPEAPEETAEPTRQAEISYAVFCLKKKKNKKIENLDVILATVCTLRLVK